jgi:hypothetical protein
MEPGIFILYEKSLVEVNQAILARSLRMVLNRKHFIWFVIKLLKN